MNFAPLVYLKQKKPFNMTTNIIKLYNQAIFDTDKKTIYKIIDEALAQGMLPEEIVFEVIVPAVDNMMLVSEKLEVNLAQHFFASQLADEITENMVAQFKTVPEKIGNVIIGTPIGDFHGLGKRIVTGCLKAHMINVFDLGLNIAAEKFVEQAILNKANIIAISSMMYHTATGENGCLKVRKLLTENHLEEKIKIIVGGAPYRFDHKLYQSVHADAWAENGNLAGIIITNLLKKSQKW